MKDELKEYIQAHKNKFDDHSIDEVEKLKLWGKISEQLPETPTKVIPLWKKASFRVAASVVLLVGCLFMYLATNQNDGEYDMVSEEFRQIDKHYKTSQDRGIAGHSLGGLFTTYCFLNSPNLFRRYGISSPVLRFNNDEILKQAELQFTRDDNWNDPLYRIFMSVGGMEWTKDISDMTQFRTSLESKNYENIDLKWKIFEDERHSSVIPAMICRTISVLYGNKY